MRKKKKNLTAKQRLAQRGLEKVQHQIQVPKNTTIAKPIEPEVVKILFCTVCKHERNFSKYYSLIPPLKLYCGVCRTRTSFEIKSTGGENVI